MRWGIIQFVSCSETILAPASVGCNQTLAVVVPTLNAARLWSAFNEGLHRQGLEAQQILVVDSSSTDGTPDLARAAGYRVLSIARSEFNHGGTRQAAAELLQPIDILVYLTQDAILASDDAIVRLLRPFEDPSIGATFGRQLPRVGAGPIESYARSFNYPAESRVRTLTTRDTLGFKAIFCSNSFAAYRTSALFAVKGFPDGVIVSEETIVFARLLLRGWKTAYVADAAVHHSHYYPYKEEFRRYFDIGVLHAREPWLLEEFGKVDGEGMSFFASQLNYLWPRHAYLIPDAVIRLFTKYAGYRVGRLESKLSRSLAKRLSQQKQYWQ
jgi:rhamnosyltransferase